MDNTNLLYPVYKCRLCGETTLAGDVHTKEEILDSIISGKNPRKFSMVEFHRCKGPYAGSFGIADFLGYRNKG